MKNQHTYSSRAIIRYVRLAREAKRYTQEFMAGKMGISQEAYSRLELHETTPTVDRLLLLSQILEIPAEELLLSGLRTEFGRNEGNEAWGKRI